VYKYTGFTNIQGIQGVQGVQIYVNIYLLEISLEHVLLFIKIGFCWTLCLHKYIYRVYNTYTG